MSAATVQYIPEEEHPGESYNHMVFIVTCIFCKLGAHPFSLQALYSKKCWWLS